MPEPIPSGQPSPPQGTVDVNALQQEVQALSKSVQQIQPFVEDASYLVAAIYQDPQLKETVQNRLKQGNQPPAQTPPPPPSSVPANQTPGNQPNNMNPQYKYDPITGQPLNPPNQTPPTQVPPSMAQNDSVTGMDIKMREDIINQIENKYGYDKMDAEKRKALRKDVEKRLNMWNTSVVTTPVNALPKLLEDAYMLSDMKGAKDEGRLQGLVEARTNDMAVLPSMGSQAPAIDAGQLSPDQREWAKKFGLDENKVSDRLKEFTETGVMTYKPQEPAAATNQPAPSGQPAPPAPAQPQNQPQS